MKSKKIVILKTFYLLLVMFVFLGCQETKVKDASVKQPEMSQPVVQDVVEKQSMRELMLELNREVEEALDQAKKHLVDGTGEEAIVVLQKAKERSPLDFRPYLLLAQMYFRADQESLGFKELEEATRNNVHTDILIRSIYPFIREGSVEQDPNENPEIFIAEFKDNKKCAISFTFDDGTKYAFTKIIPIFEEFEYKATIPVNAGVVPEDPSNPWWGTWKDWRSAHKRGFEIANHTTHHEHLPSLSDDVLDAEVNGGWNMIKENVGTPPRSFVFPFDKADAKSLKKAAERHAAIREHDYLALTYKNVFIPAYGGKSMFASTGALIVDLAIQKKLWLIPECHSVGDKEIKTYKPITTDFLRQHLSYIKEREESIWVDTFINVYSYLAQRKAADLSFEKIGENSLAFTLTTSLDARIIPSPLSVVINTDSFQAKSASAVLEDGGEPVDVAIKEKQLIVNVTPNRGPVRVQWD